MSIPIATTTIRVLRTPIDPARDPEDAPPAGIIVVSGVRAQISTSSGRELVQGASTQEIADYRMSCDPCDIAKDDRIEDESTGEVYEVTTVAQRSGYGLDHTYAGLRQVNGSIAQLRAPLR